MRILLLMLAAAVLLTSCEKNIEVKLPESKPKLVINAEMLEGQMIYIQLTRSVSGTEYVYLEDITVPNATVKLYRNGQFLMDMEEVPSSGNFDQSTYYLSNEVAAAGNLYTIKVSAAGYDDVVASAELLDVVAIDTLWYTGPAGKTSGDIELDGVNFRLSDPAASTDYYRIVVTTSDTSESSNFVGVWEVYSSDPSIEDAYGSELEPDAALDGRYIFMRDQLFNGKEKEVRLLLPHYSLQYIGLDSNTTYLGGKAKVMLFHITEDYFRYLKSYVLASDSNGDPFSEPVNVYTNVKNGYGVFSTSGRSVKVIDKP